MPGGGCLRPSLPFLSRRACPEDGGRRAAGRGGAGAAGEAAGAAEREQVRRPGGAEGEGSEEGPAAASGARAPINPPSPTASHLATSLPPPWFPAPPGVTVAGLTLSPGRAGLVSASAARSRTVALLLERFSLRGFIPSASSFTVPF